MTAEAFVDEVFRTIQMVASCQGNHLTEREIDILRCVAMGMDARQAALVLQISHRTTEYHLAQMMRRTGSRNRAELVARSYVTGILLPEEWPPAWSGRFCSRIPVQCGN
jgi:DNA-binding CsgD family transcriptional regulator